jgi:invasion protein IalB
MRRALAPLFLAAMICQAGIATAQETAATPELNLGQPAASAENQPYVKEEFGDWSLRCLPAPEGQEERCNLYQLLTGPNGAAIAEFSMFRIAEGTEAVAGATVVAPLETLLTQQLTISIDGTEARRYPFSFCNAGGCVARIGFTQAEIDQMKRGTEARMRLVPASAPDQEVVLTISLSGFTAGFDAAPAR